MSQWRVAGISAIGTSHKQSGAECQDTWAVNQAVISANLEVVTAVCVSDGAGSVKKAFAGARLTAFVVSNWLHENFSSALTLTQNQIGKACLAKIRRSIRRTAERTRSSPNEYAATLVAVCVGANGAWLALHLGDGGIVGEFANQVLVVSPPEKGEFANESWFVTSPDALEHLRVYGSPFNRDLCKPTGFVIFSDGVENSLLDRRTGTVAHAASVMLGWLREHPSAMVSKALEQNINMVFREQSYDDCTIVLMAKPKENQPAYLEANYE
ncbi:MAG: PP2C family serine/threonine-protein phosphatase [Sedimentisphaerales bacterium]